MTIETQTNRVQYAGNGSAVNFPVPFPLYAEKHLQLILTGPDVDDTTLTDNYTVNGTGTANVSVTYPNSGPPMGAGYKLTITRQLPLVQELDLENGGAFNADNIEAALDVLEMQIQQIAEVSDRAIKIAITSDANSDEFSQELKDAHTETLEAAAQAKQSEGNAAASAARAANSAAQTKADADRAAWLVDPASLASSVFNVRKAFVLEQPVKAGEIITLPGYYFPMRDVLYLSYGGTLCTPRLPMLESAGAYQYAEVGSDPNTPGNQVQVFFDLAAGDVLDMWVVASNAGSNITELEKLVMEARKEATAAAASAVEAAEQVNLAAGQVTLAADEVGRAAGEADRAEGEADRAAIIATQLPDINLAVDGQVIVARDVAGTMQAGYENPPSAQVAEQVSILAADLPARELFSVPVYIVGANKLQVFMDGVRGERGHDPSTAFFAEQGTNGTSSTQIIFHQTLNTGTQISVIAAA